MTEVAARTSVARSLLAFDAIGFSVSLLAMLSKVMSVTGWSIVILFLFLALGNAYFLFMRQSEI